MVVADVPGLPARGSFRDPGGALHRHQGRILRSVEPAFVPTLEDFLGSPTAQNAIDAGKLVRSAAVPPSDFPELGAAHLWEHDPIPFPSFPYEWPPEMLHAAAGLTLDLAESALADGFGLKDASPYNVLFRGGRPVFVDVLSFERREPLDCTWMAYAQFVRTFLLPLMAKRYLGLPLDTLLSGRRDGIEPRTMYRWIGAGRRLLPPFLGLVTLPSWFEGKDAVYQPKRAKSPEQARFILEGLFRQCRRQLNSLRPTPVKESTWTGYLDGKSLYSEGQLLQKQAFIEAALALVRPQTVLDVGANEGRFSQLAAKSGASVVAIDFDPAVAGTIWRNSLEKEGRPASQEILPLVVDLARPTPATGWRNLECASFLDRARGKFDLVLMLAVVHHVLITERIPLEDLLGIADELSKEYILVEFVGPADAMFQKLVRGRGELYAHMSQAWFEASALRRFELVRSTRIEGLNRWLYLFRRRHATS